MKGLTENIKSALCVLLVVALTLFSGMRLMEIQVVGDKNIADPMQISGEGTISYIRKVKATRGEILDYSGNLLVGNNPQCDLVLRKAFFPEDLKEGNKTLLGIYNALKGFGYEFKMSMPISMDTPYVFTKGDKEELISNLKLNVYATAENCMDKLISDYEIDNSYSDKEKRIIAGLRYEMIVKDFSYEMDMVIAENVDNETLVQMKELGNVYKGVQAVESSDREIKRGDIIPHAIGTVGPIYAEEYDELKTQGYALDDTLGKSGMEAAMEKELKGSNGQEEVIIKNGAVVDVKTITHTETGKSVRLTVDGNFQLRLQGILENFLKDFPSINPKPNILNAQCGAIAVMDVKTGAVKGLANAPTYNLKDYSKYFDYFMKAENTPLLDRTTFGLYRPGSTFKTITATAGLNEGIVNGNTVFNCLRDYMYYGSKFSCTGYHGGISMRRAIEVSCNSYFYELSSRLGIDKITEYSQLYGLGSPTGIETGDAAGYLCNPETFEKNGIPWLVGFVIQAGIGNMDCGITPLQMAVVASTIANKGVRYKPYLVDGLYDCSTKELISQTQPTVAAKIDTKDDHVYDSIIEGMIDASKNMPYKYSISNLGFDVAIKTGTPQVSNNLQDQNSFFIGFAPADNPEVAFAGVIEHGEYSKYMIRDLLLAYQECYGLNGVAPKKKALPKEEKYLIVSTTAAKTTSTTTTSTTSVSTTSATANGNTGTSANAQTEPPVNTTVSGITSSNVSETISSPVTSSVIVTTVMTTTKAAESTTAAPATESPTTAPPVTEPPTTAPPATNPPQATKPPEPRTAKPTKQHNNSE